MAILKTQIKIRRGAYDDIKNEVLAAGEPAVSLELDEDGKVIDPADVKHMQFAVGDGTSGFGSLSFKLNAGVTNISGVGEENHIAIFGSERDIKNSSVLIGVTDDDLGNVTTPGQFISHIPTNSNKSPLEVSSTILVSNLNADLLDGKQGIQYFSRDWLGYTENAEDGLFPVLATEVANETTTAGQLYVNIAKAVSNAKITLKSSDIVFVEKDNFTLNQSDSQEIELQVQKSSLGNRAQNTIVSAFAEGVLQSNEYNVTYVNSGDQQLKLGANIYYDQFIGALKFVF